MEWNLFSLAPNVDFGFPLRIRSRVTAPSTIRSEEIKVAALLNKKQPYSIDVLPDECLFEILRRLPRGRERWMAACVSKRWLMLLSTIEPSEDIGILQKESELLGFSIKSLPDLNYPEPCTVHLNCDSRIDGYLTRCLDAKEACDIRLAALAVSTGGCGELGKLKIRGGNSVCKTTDVGLSAIGHSCPYLRSLSVWKLPLITNKGLLSIATGCPLLENLDLCQCPSISDEGLISIAKKCPNLISLTIDSCPGISDDGLQVIASGCLKLVSISIKDSPLVGDKGISKLVSCASSSLKKLKLHNVNITDVSLAVIGHYGKAITNISLSSLRNVNERGFWVMGNAQNLVSLTSCTISCCSGVTDRSVEAISKGLPRLSRLGIRMSHNLSDTGLRSITEFAKNLESLQLEDCNGSTLVGILDILLTSNTNLKNLALVNCLGIRDTSFHQGELPACTSLQCLTIRDCPGFANCLPAVGKICPNLRKIDLSGLVGISDTGFLPLIESSKSGLVKVNLERCANLSDAIISAMVVAHGSSLKSLNLNGCKKVTDRSLLAISTNCSALKDLDVSRCNLTDLGVVAIASAEQLNLRTFSLAGCTGVSKKCLLALEKMKGSLKGLNIQQCKDIQSHEVGSLEEKLWWCDILF